VHDAIGIERGLAYTTLMTVLDRMSKKGLVERERDGRAWRYSPHPIPPGAARTGPGAWRRRWRRAGRC
jgi:hypothetical protein